MANPSKVQFLVNVQVEDKSEIHRGVLALRLYSMEQSRPIPPEKWYLSMSEVLEGSDVEVSPVFLLRPVLAERLARELLNAAAEARRAEES